MKCHKVAPYINSHMHVSCNAQCIKQWGIFPAILGPSGPSQLHCQYLPFLFALQQHCKGSGQSVWPPIATKRCIRIVPFYRGLLLMSSLQLLGYLCIFEWGLGNEVEIGAFYILHTASRFLKCSNMA